MRRLRFSGSIIIVLALFPFSMIEMSDRSYYKKWDLDIVFIGNSITEGAQLGSPGVEAPPATASEYLEHRSHIGNVEFINQGKSGVTAIDYIPSDTGALKDVISSAHKFHKDNKKLLIFTISLGTNDYQDEGTDPEYQKNLKSIADRLISEFPKCKIVFLQPIWYSPNNKFSSEYMAEGLAGLQSYFPELQALVLRYSRLNPGQIFLGDLKGFAYLRNNYLTELIPESGNAGTFYLHPNKKGAIVLGRLWGQAIYESIFKDLISSNF